MSSTMVQTEMNHLLSIGGEGHINLNSQSEVNMNEIYFEPSLSFNLVLIRSITNIGFTFVFDDKGCTIH